MEAHIPEAASLSGRLGKSKLADFLSHSWKRGGLNCGEVIEADIAQKQESLGVCSEEFGLCALEFSFCMTEVVLSDPRICYRPHYRRRLTGST